MSCNSSGILLSVAQSSLGPSNKLGTVFAKRDISLQKRACLFIQILELNSVILLLGLPKVPCQSHMNYK